VAGRARDINARTFIGTDPRPRMQPR